MSTKPTALVLLDDAVSHLRSHLRKHREIVPASFAGQLCGILSHWGRQQLAGNEVIHPGLAQMARWGGCKLRQANYNLATLREWGVMEGVAYAKGGRRATRYVVHIDLLARALVALGTSPTPALLNKLRGAGNPAKNPALRRPRNPAQKQALSAAGIQDYQGRAPLAPPKASAREAKPRGGASLETHLPVSGRRFDA